MVEEQKKVMNGKKLASLILILIPILIPILVCMVPFEEGRIAILTLTDLKHHTGLILRQCCKGPDGKDCHQLLLLLLQRFPVVLASRLGA
jgi:hypothetical protein